MDDEKIIELYFARSENAIKETEESYGNYCRKICGNILSDKQDKEECVSDVYLKLWNTIPPTRPESLKAYLGRIARNISLNKYSAIKTAKRKSDNVSLALEELQECIPSGNTVEKITDNKELARAINSFLCELSKETRIIFMQRYWYLRSVKEIARDCNCGESKVKMTLMRTRKKLREFLEKEGIEL